MIAYLQVEETAWTQLLSDWEICQDDPDNCTIADEDVKRLLRNGQLVDGFWKELAGFKNVNCIGSEAELDALHDYFAPADVNMYHKWNFNGKVNFPTEYTGQYDDILTLHEDHVTYDENGNETSRTAASFEDPNWANQWVGQDENRFSREFSREFGEEFA